MNKKCVLIRYGEIYLKGKNRGYFENSLISNIKKSLTGIDCYVYKISGRFLLSDYDESNENYILSKLVNVFGIQSFSKVIEIDTDQVDIENFCKNIEITDKTFKVEVKRADKSFPMTSPQLEAHLGGVILSRNPNLKVDLFHPEKVVYIDIRENKKTYIFHEVIKGAGGMPVGTSGKGLLLLSGGIDSPVAGYMMAKRGMKLDAIYFHSFPYTGEQAKQKVITLARILKEYSNDVRLHVVPFTKIQETINEKCSVEFMITIMRRFMMRIAERVAIDKNAKALITGENLAQVASQTVESMTVTEDVVDKLPVFRPLIAYDKEEIITVAKKIGSFETSILPFEDCCTVFVPEHPVTKPKVYKAEREESKISNIEELINTAIENIEVIDI